MSTIDAQATARIAARYPTVRPRRAGFTVLAVVLMVALAGWILWAGLHRANPGITAQVSGYRVVSPTSVSITLAIDRPDPSRPGSCQVQAIATSGEVVGEETLTLPAETARSATVTTTISTYLPATTAILKGCQLS